MSKCKDCNCDIIHTPDTGAISVKRVEETLLCYPCHDQYVEVFPKDIMTTIEVYLQRFPTDKQGMDSRMDYLNKLNEIIILISEGLTNGV